MRTFVVLVIFAVQSALLALAFHNTYEWYYSPQLLTKQTKMRVSDAIYPNITLCHPGYFNMKKAEGKVIRYFLHFTKVGTLNQNLP